MMRCRLSVTVRLIFGAGWMTLLLWSMTGFAAVPQLINYQGSLTDPSGQPVPDGNYQIKFKIYGSLTGTDSLWYNGFQSIAVSKGSFSYLLGSHTPLPEDLFRISPRLGPDTIRYLGITVGTDPEISPRTRLVSVPFTYHALWSDSSNYATMIRDNSVNGATILDGAITNADVSNSAEIAPTKIDGTAMVLSASWQTVSGFVQFTGPVYMYDSVFRSSQYGVKIGSAVAHDPSGGLLEVTRDYNTTGTRYGEKVSLQNGSTGSLYGLRSDVEHTTAGSGGTACALYGGGVSDGTVREGVYGLAEAQNAAITTGTSYGISGAAFDGATAYGVYGYAGSATTNYAGYFNGNVSVTGTLTKGGGAFKIDHPLDPEHKYLQHSFVESPDMMDIYNGNIILDSLGEAQVELPEWFGALNKDFRYQLTAIGAPGPNLHVAEEIHANRFRVAGGLPGMKVSWQVTGVRQDPWAQANRIQIEVDKNPQEQGRYLHPEVYDQAIERGVDYESLHPILETRAESLNHRSAGTGSE